MQPELPNLPPIQQASSKPDVSAFQQPTAPPNRNAPVGTRRLRQFMSYASGASLGFILLIVAGQAVLKPGLRPTDIAATMEAQVELGLFNQRLGGQPGEMTLTEDQYRAKIAEAERTGAARAELGYQQKFAAVQADRERVVSAYATLYQRTNAIAQAGLQMEAQAQQFRQQLIAMTNGGRSVVIGAKDIFCGLGSAEACDSAREDRRTMIEEGDERTRTDLGARIRELMSGIDDPAAFTVHDDERRHGVPAIQR